MKYIAKTAEGIIQEWAEDHYNARDAYYTVSYRWSSYKDWKMITFIHGITDLKEAEEYVTTQSKQNINLLYRVMLGEVILHSLWEAGECVYRL